MKPDSLLVTKKLETLCPNKTRVITRPHIPGGEERAKKTLKRVLSLRETKVNSILKHVLDSFSGRHKDIKKILTRNYNMVRGYMQNSTSLSTERKMLIGAYFTMEYSIESAAFFNPSTVLHPDQSGLDEGSIRIILSFRAIGEGHISSIEFRSGVFDKDNNIVFDPTSKYLDTPEVLANPTYDKYCFELKLKEIGVDYVVLDEAIKDLPEQFTYDELKESIEDVRRKKLFHNQLQERTLGAIIMLANSNYEVNFHADHTLSERVIFPVTASESRGIEDARFVKFTNDDGSSIYYATYTAYDGFNILPQLIETKDFLHFKIITLNGKAARDKGMALFPRKINGKFAMLSRIDGENLYLSFSDNIHFWHDAQKLQKPECSWEFVQIGNCGSPIETKAGWLVLTHGVGPMRRYCIGVTLLDLKNPFRIIGKLKEPILYPDEDEREGYVPNVVYTCGAIIHNDSLIIPYAIADLSSKIAVVSLTELLSRLLH